MFHRVTNNGAPHVKGKRATGFSNCEEDAVQLIKVVPFLVEDELKRVGGLNEKALIGKVSPSSMVASRLVKIPRPRPPRPGRS